jgi:hypothetical protein
LAEFEPKAGTGPLCDANDPGEILQLGGDLLGILKPLGNLQAAADAIMQEIGR